MAVVKVLAALVAIQAVSLALANSLATQNRREISEQFAQASMQGRLVLQFCRVESCLLDTIYTASATPCQDAGYSGCCSTGGGSCRTTSGCFCDLTCYTYNDCCSDIRDINCLPMNESMSIHIKTPADSDVHM